MKHANIAFFVPMIGCPHRCSFCDQNSITGESGVPTPEEVDITLKKAAKELDFIQAAQYRDEIIRLQAILDKK